MECLIMRHRIRILVIAVLGTLVVSGCSKHADQSAEQSKPSVAVMTDTGHVEAQKISTQGSGSTEAEALTDALKKAVMQVNGTAISMASLSINGNADAHIQASNSAGQTYSEDDYLQSKENMEAVAQSSGGLIDHFTITKVDKPSLLSKGYMVSIDAYINKYHAAGASSKKLKIIVAPIHSSQGTYQIGDLQISRDELSKKITQRIENALVQTGRFDVLNRDSNPEIDQELNLISSGETDKSNLAKLNQTIPADAILIGSIDAMNYDKHSQTLTISDHPLVSYDGHWGISSKIVNVITRETINSDQFSGDFPKVGPTTLPTSVDSQGLLSKAEDSMANQIASQVVKELFPITIVSIQGDTIVLSQGVSSVHEGQSYQLMKAGQEIKDSQTGEVIGHVKSPAGILMIDRVDDKMSYGHLTGGTVTALAADGSVRLDKAVDNPPLTVKSPQTDRLDTSQGTTPSPAPANGAATPVNLASHPIRHKTSAPQSKQPSGSTDSSEAAPSRDKNW